MLAELSNSSLELVYLGLDDEANGFEIVFVESKYRKFRQHLILESGDSFLVYRILKA